MSGDETAFFYGTLMAPEVFFSVCYGDSNPPKVIQNLHTFIPAILHDHCRHRVRFADYPGVIPEPGHSVRGILATGLTDANVAKLDVFEGSDYLRKKTSIKLLKKENGKEVEGTAEEAWVYLFKDPEDLEKVEWDFEEFRREKMRNWTRGDWRFEQDPNDKAQVSHDA
ncbi:gamma-glutamyl cyclotransferase, AIG2-like domain-containing protein [Sarocladium implicatum]|nr:gamma-glutamyl cyclotransferase, AIG2-like domain-containing protein [Sarocladium implicatum]